MEVAQHLKLSDKSLGLGEPLELQVHPLKSTPVFYFIIMKSISLSFIFLFIIFSVIAKAQDSLFIYKSDCIIGKYGISGIDSIKFINNLEGKNINGVSSSTLYAQDSLFIYKFGFVIGKYEVSEVYSLEFTNKSGLVNVDSIVSMDSPSLSYIKDSVRITFQKSDLYSTEVFYSEDSVNYTMISALPAGFGQYNYYSAQNKTVYFKIRYCDGENKGQFSKICKIATPLVIKSDQTILSNVIISSLDIQNDKHVLVDWGDGVLNVYTGKNTNIIKSYLQPSNPYYIRIFGDIDYITKFKLENQSSCYGDISKWNLPKKLLWFEINYCNAFTGCLNSWILPASLHTFCFSNNSNVIGNPFNFGIPNSISSLDINTCTLNGNLSSVSIPSNSNNINFFADCACFRGLPRGNFEFVKTYSFAKNICSTAEIDNLLKYIDNYFSNGVTPHTDCDYILNEDGMDRPTGGVNNCNLLSIKSKYTSVGKKCEIKVNDNQIAYSDQSSKQILNLNTYEGSGQTCHPSVINIGYKWNGYQYWMANTPYPGGAQMYENPSLWASNDGVNWKIPENVVNPIIPKPDGPSSFNADPDLYFENGVLYLIWKESKNGFSTTKISSTIDLINWSKYITIADPSDNQCDTKEQASPSLIKINNLYYLYYLDMKPGNFRIRRRSSLKIDGYYSNAEDVKLDKIANRGFWHFTVRSINGVIWLVTNVTSLDNTNSYGPFIILARSSDGLSFIRDADNYPTIYKTEDWEIVAPFYRPTLVLIGNQMVVYYSFRETGKSVIWKTAKINVYAL